MTSPFGRGADAALPPPDSPAYWDLVARAATGFVKATREGLINREAIGIVIALQQRYPHGTLDLATVLLAGVQERCRPEHLTDDGIPDLDLLAPNQVDAVTVLEATSKANAFFGRGPATAADIEHTQQQVSVHGEVRAQVTAAWRTAAAAPPPSRRSALRSALSSLERDARATAAALSLAVAAALKAP
jgi:hypothetical protein